jgi:hypothetical protein
MIFRRAVFWVFVSFMLVRPSFAASDAVNGLRLHWIGLNQISTDPNSAPFLKVWQLPQTTALVAQTLDKLSRWPGHGATNAASAALRPLLDDLIASEFYLELSAPTNSSLSAGGEGRGEVGSANSALRPSPFALLLAVRLPADRANFWQTNLAAAAAAWAAASTPHRIECSRAGDWTLVGVSAKIAKTDFAAHLTSAHKRAIANLWLEADFNPSMLADFFSLSARRTGGEGQGEVGSLLSPATRPSSLSSGAVGNPNIQQSTSNSQTSSLSAGGKGGGEVGFFSPFAHLHLTITGDSSNLLTRATLDLARPFAEPLSAWEIPTNLIHGPLTSFAAVRGIGPWLAASTVWQKLQLSPAPDQACCWSRDGIPFQTYLAAPLPGASNQLAQLSQRLMQDANPWLATNAEGSLAWSNSLPGILWNDANLLTPFLISVDFNHHDYVLGGLYPPVADAPALPPVRFRNAIRQQPNLVFGEVEGTGSRVEDGFFITQVSRIVLHKPQMPHTAAGTVWLKAAEQLIGESTTFVTLDSPQRLIVERHSTLGLNALELHLLADWLESPQFPRGLHTFLAPPDRP